VTSEFGTCFESYARRIVARQPMVMYRFGDGELMLTEGKPVGSQTQAGQIDRWQAPAHLTRLGQVLRHVLSCEEPQLHFGIPCTCCNPAGHQWLTTKLRRSQLFPANLFVNANYPRFQALMAALADRPVAVVVNERAATCRLPFRSLREQRVPDQCVTRFQSHAEEVQAQSRATVSDLRGVIVLVAAGPMSEALIHVMWNSNPHNTYLDVGSAIDEYLYGQKTRPYQIAGTAYAQRHCVI
jgi:hypothetical protein